MEKEYEQKVKERFKKYTLGFTIIVSYCIGNDTSVNTYAFSTKKEFNKHHKDWESHFKTQSEQSKKDGVHYSYLMNVYRNLVFNELGISQLQFSSYEEAMEELE